jgi:hypothetical protein
MTPDEIAKFNGFKNQESQSACRDAMVKLNITISINRDQFIKGWHECEKWIMKNE